MSKRIFILSPHADDGILGCGGVISKFIKRKYEVFYLVFSDGTPVIHSCIVTEEIQKAGRILGIPKDCIWIKSWKTRTFEKYRQAILDWMIRLERKWKPDMVFVPSSQDFHQDHMTIFREALRAFKFSSTLLGYEELWNNLKFGTTCFIQIEASDLGRKSLALKCCSSQKDRYYFSDGFAQSLALVRGTQIKTKYAEAFEILRWIIK